MLIPVSALVVNPYVGCIALFYVLLFVIFVIPKLALKFELLAGKLLEDYAAEYVAKLIGQRSAAEEAKKEDRFTGICSGSGGGSSSRKVSPSDLGGH